MEAQAGEVAESGSLLASEHLQGRDPVFCGFLA